MLIGLDFDNTIANYDHAFYLAAQEFGFVPENFTGTKKDVKEFLLSCEGGMRQWQTLQGHVYGSGISKASIYEGLSHFLNTVKASSSEIIIISHKTEFGHFDPDKINLRTAALKWMEENKFFSEDGFGLSKSSVHFGATRDEKITKICHFNPDVFVDDLSEVLDHPQFPHDQTRAILFNSSAKKKEEQTYMICSSWQEIENTILV